MYIVSLLKGTRRVQHGVWTHLHAFWIIRVRGVLVALKSGLKTVMVPPPPGGLKKRPGVHIKATLLMVYSKMDGKRASSDAAPD